MNFEDLVVFTFKTEEEYSLEEATIPLTPFLAFASFKKDAFSNLKNKLIDIKDAPGKAARKAKAAGAAAKETARAAVGKETEGTVYKLTPEQVSIMKEMMNKYGKEIASDVMKFRRNILAPYQVVKRLVKKHSSVSAKDIHGITKEEFKKAVESGKKKIENRSKLDDSSENIREKIKDYRRYYSNLEKAEKALENNERIPTTIAQRLFKEFEVSDPELGSYSPDQLRRTYDSIQNNYEKMINLTQKLQSDDSDVDQDEVRAAIRRRQELWSGKAAYELEKTKQGIDLTKSEREKFYQKGSFNTALGKYFFRREILNQLKPGATNVFKKTYLSIIKELKEKNRERRKKLIEDLKDVRKDIEFTENEAKIWKKHKGTSDYSGDMDDYYQAVDEKDFPEKPIHVEKSPELEKAQQEIENAIKRFERSLQKKMKPEDFAKLKRYRLINNLISVKELKDPSKLFKDSEQIKDFKSSGDEDDSENVTIKDIEKKADDILGTNYDSKDELQSDYNELNDMIKDFSRGNKKADEELGTVSKKIKMVTRKLEK